MRALFACFAAMTRRTQTPSFAICTRPQWSPNDEEELRECLVNHIVSTLCSRQEVDRLIARALGADQALGDHRCQQAFRLGAADLESFLNLYALGWAVRLDVAQHPLTLS